MKSMIKHTYILLLGTFIFLIGCGSYRGKSEAFQQKIQNEDYSGALNEIDKNSFLKKKRNQLLYYMEKGKIAYLNEAYELSNEFFNKADVIIDQNKSALGGKLIGVLTNPEQEFYKGEDFEKVAIHYYKAINYMFLKNIDEALVEARKITLQLQEINEKYPLGKKNRYTNDTFAMTLQGLLYESSGDMNNAFIAYRNSIDLYLENGGNYFGVTIPDQLKQDFFRTADFMGFYNEIQRYETLLNSEYKKKPQEKTREAVIFWENGLAPYKDETSFTFSMIQGKNNSVVSFFNEDLNLYIPVPDRILGNDNQPGLDVFRVAFPKYINRETLFVKAKVLANSTEYPFQLTEDYEHIAFKTLKDRTHREIGKTALRLAVKKTSEYVLKDQEKISGTLLGIFNAITEGADTRNWQSLPAHIHYSRIPINNGENKVEVVLEDQYNNTITKVLKIQESGKIVFAKISTPEVL